MDQNNRNDKMRKMIARLKRENADVLVTEAAAELAGEAAAERRCLVPPRREGRFLRKTEK